MGSLSWTCCHFTNNSLSAELAAMLAGGGGGLVIEANAVTSQFNCTIANLFVNNTGTEQKVVDLSQAPIQARNFILEEASL